MPQRYSGIETSIVNDICSFVIRNITYNIKDITMTFNNSKRMTIKMMHMEVLKMPSPPPLATVRWKENWRKDLNNYYVNLFLKCLESKGNSPETFSYNLHSSSYSALFLLRSIDIFKFMYHVHLRTILAYQWYEMRERKFRSGQPGLSSRLLGSEKPTVTYTWKDV